jgi:hypothetical protein
LFRKPQWRVVSCESRRHIKTRPAARARFWLREWLPVNFKFELSDPGECSVSRDAFLTKTGSPWIRSTFGGGGGWGECGRGDEEQCQQLDICCKMRHRSQTDSRAIKLYHILDLLDAVRLGEHRPQILLHYSLHTRSVR